MQLVEKRNHGGWNKHDINLWEMRTGMQARNSKKIIYRNTEQTANMDNKCILHVRFQTSGRLLKQHQLLAEAEVNKVQ
jgi:hypothetical protein